MNKRQQRKQFKKLAYLFRTVDKQNQLMPSLLLTSMSDLATRFGWCERFTVQLGTLRQRWQRLTPKGIAIKQRFMADNPAPPAKSG